MVLAGSGSGGLAEDGGAGRGLEGPGTRPEEVNAANVDEEHTHEDEGPGIWGSEYAGEGVDSAESRRRPGGAGDDD